MATKDLIALGMKSKLVEVTGHWALDLQDNVQKRAWTIIQQPRRITMPLESTYITIAQGIQDALTSELLKTSLDCCERPHAAA